MGEVEAQGERVTRHELRHDRHTVSLLTDHLVFSPKYRGKVLLGEVAEAAEEIIRENCKELDIEVIDKPFFKKESFTKETGISAT
ncbi:MAG: transposase [Euryarchaeota archaeon]|nr:transposase [Euryarchaeota archaeon]